MKIQLTTIMRYHYTLIRMAKIHSTDNPKCSQGYGATEAHLSLLGMKIGTATLEDSSVISGKNFRKKL